MKKLYFGFLLVFIPLNSPKVIAKTEERLLHNTIYLRCNLVKTKKEKTLSDSPQGSCQFLVPGGMVCSQTKTNTRKKCDLPNNLNTNMRLFTI